MAKWGKIKAGPVILLLSVVLLASTSLAAAHGIEILSSDPADGAVLTQAPALVKAAFSAELAVDGSYMAVYDSASQEVDLKNGGVDLEDAAHTSMKVGLPGGLPDGIYVVRWQAMLPDGDAVLGTFQFTVSAAPYPAGQVQPQVAGGPDAQNADPYPAGDLPQTASAAETYLKKIFQDRNSLVGAGIGALAVILGILVLIRKLTAGKD